MAVSYIANSTDGAIYKVLCEVCKIPQKHIVLKSLRRKNDVGEFTSITEYEIVQCQNCDSLSFRKEYSNSENYYQDEETGNYETLLDVDIFPSRTAGRFKIEGIHFLPLEVRAAYDELILAMNGGQNMLAGLGVRVLIEMICRDKKAAGDNLYKKLDALRVNGEITVSDLEILHKIRAMGNYAAHEAKASTSAQLTLAMNVVENLLKSVYIHPKLAATAFKE
ncbi:DUF4145 domain-containing protein [Pseudomonas aeruginosa]|uniref:DUF4145 domain-containing protein n=1 Tax=Pseudomonas aeruginosa TaxID=287 RepID=UPI002104C849|nr:DUF4145 domain-containing protein [Pseudomonas aeruginosa]UTX28424.1 DUF4145 domain-containing protein [Pseudomonas aeruginosa]HCL3646898.1 DUF4145 domain-containing protein [Pseudomonas aeruginosa]HCT2654605.1 DUF4145 domain-containing protein [Pseudomonas aeruginosa]